MLSGESAMGKYPEEAVMMLAQIAAATEAGRPLARLEELRQNLHQQKSAPTAEALASVVEHALETVPFAAVFIPTRGGTTARMISRFKPSVWSIAVSADRAACQGLAFSYGVHPIEVAEAPTNWRDFVLAWLGEQQLTGGIAMLVAGPSDHDPEANYRLEFMRVGGF
jgi:pyruvate kinase